MVERRARPPGAAAPGRLGVAADPPAGERPARRHDADPTRRPLDPARAGSVLFLYTDGLVERRGRDIDAGLDALLATVTDRQSDTLDAILDDLLADVAETELRDDVALLAVRVGLPAPAGDVRETLVRLPADLTAPGLGREHVAAITADLSREAQDTAALLASELITNAVRSGLEPITLRTRRSPGALEVAVHDHGPERPVLPDGEFDLTAPNGRGLLIVETLADRWGTTVDEEGPGKSSSVPAAKDADRVTGRLPIPPRRPP